MPEKKKYKIELTRLSIFLLGCGFVFLIIWSFILGIFVGESFLPEREKSPKKRKYNLEKEEKIDFSFHEELTSDSFKNNTCYSVQVAAFLREKDAQDMVKRLIAKGYKAYYTRGVINKKTYYRVRCGRSYNKKEIKILRDRLLKDEHIKGIIVRCR